MSFQNTLSLDFRFVNGRRTMDVGLAAFTEAELLFLAETFSMAEKGSAVDFNIGATEDGRRCMQFVIGRPQPKVCDATA